MGFTGDLDKQYDRLLESRLLSVLRTYPLSFCDLVREIGGAFPTDVRRVLRGLIDQKLIIEHEGRFSTCAGKKLPTIQAFLPPLRMMFPHESEKDANEPERRECIFAEPHPADYDWRFTPATIRTLEELLRRSAAPEAKIALLGAPTLYLHLARKGSRVALFDRSHSLLEDLRQAGYARSLIEHDLSNPILDKHATFDLVLADPPWYRDSYRAFICRASELLQQEGLLLLSVLPWLTRPSAIEDRAAILSFASEMSFDLLQAIPSFLAYESPVFERATLKRHGLKCGDWRIGDLFVFRFVGKPVNLAIQLTDEPQWDEFRFGPLKVKLRRRKEESSGHFSFRPVSRGVPILDTVSRRSPLRARIDFWTSRNVAYRIVGTDILRDALTRLESKKTPEGISQQLSKEHVLSEEDARNLTNILSEILNESAKGLA